MHRRRADHESQSARTGRRSPEGAHERAYPGRITKGRSAHVRDEQNRSSVQDGEQVLPDRIGIRHVYFYGQLSYGYPADPQHGTTFTRHESPPSARKRRWAASLDPGGGYPGWASPRSQHYSACAGAGARRARDGPAANRPAVTAAVAFGWYGGRSATLVVRVPPPATAARPLPACRSGPRPRQLPGELRGPGRPGADRTW